MGFGGRCPGPAAIGLSVVNGVAICGCRTDGEARGILRILRYDEVSVA